MQASEQQSHKDTTKALRPGDVESSIWFLERRELYATVKPYTLAFTPEISIPRENIRREEKHKIISDIRRHRDEISFAKNGFTVLEMPELPDMIDWDDKTSVQTRFYPTIVSEIEKAFPGSRCIALHHQIRKRDVSFPSSTGKDYTYGQPLLAAHIDTVRSSAEQLVQERLGEKAESILMGRYMIANVWRPLHGPNDDYPLALCDLTTVDQQHDLEIADYVTPKLNREHCLVYSSDSHHWWYLSGHKTTEGLVFVQYDSEKGVASGMLILRWKRFPANIERIGVPHASFENPNSRQQKPRQSIEIPMLIWYE